MASQQAYPVPTTQQGFPVPGVSERVDIPGLVLVGGYETTETDTQDIVDTLTVEVS